MPPDASTSGPETVSASRRGAVTLITLDRPDARNAVDPATAFALYRAIVAFEADDEAAVAVLAGAGGSFCAGFDLKTLSRGEAADWLAQLHFGETGQPPLGPMGPTRLRLGKPVIAAIAGAAVAGGMELALWCDMRVMERDAWMGVLCRRWGVPLIDGGTVRLPRLVGQGRALDLVLTGRRIEAAECHAIGLCDRVVAPGDAVDAAMALAAELAALPQACLRGDRAAARFGAFSDEEAALRAEFQAGLDVLRADGLRGAAAFAAGAGRHGAPGDDADGAGGGAAVRPRDPP
ncbi:crotonase/enoyl-CoA hydratase family protein [Wenzhouxiangella sp. XN24]|uniref:crotonase/enoyl-CoA hydratase family protein n=1 Tax=Wenzhouxiangella sp. XN24 TaxID=2713569 RepID=UPI0013EDEC90|nr:crotonase/enoyl-CoA hydratase family protein [Wenzhouxiangella sp. XN24]NGX16640.1 crotonase/enoyl-CoA hydratase family protein [Wenzhouxiangella sp. XN24]